MNYYCQEHGYRHKGLEFQGARITKPQPWSKSAPPYQLLPLSARGSMPMGGEGREAEQDVPWGMRGLSQWKAAALWSLWPKQMTWEKSQEHILGL